MKIPTNLGLVLQTFFDLMAGSDHDNMYMYIYLPFYSVANIMKVLDSLFASKPVSLSLSWAVSCLSARVPTNPTSLEKKSLFDLHFSICYNQVYVVSVSEC